MDDVRDEQERRRDAVLRRMLATPKPGKGEKKGGEAKSTTSDERTAAKPTVAPANPKS